MAKKKFESPYPKVGEIIRAIAVAIDTKSYSNNLDRYAREGDYDSSLRAKTTQEAVLGPLLASCDQEFALYFEKQFGAFLDDYIDLMLNVPLDGLNRSEALSILGTHFYSYHGALFLYFISGVFGFPVPAHCDFSKNQAVDGVFQWIESNISGWTEFHDGLEKVHKDQIVRWRKGLDLPRYKSIVEMHEWSETNQSISEAEIQVIRRNLIIARAIDHFKRNKVGKSVFYDVVNHIRNGLRPFDIGKRINESHRAIASRFTEFFPSLASLDFKLRRTEKKPKGAQNQTRQELDAYRTLQNRVDPEGLTSHMLEMFEGRWMVFSGRYKEALKFYKMAVECSLYNAGPIQERIIRETLVLAAKCNDRPYLKKLKNQMIAFGFQMELDDEAGNFSNVNNAVSRSKDSVVEDWEARQWAGYFDRMFSKACYFEEYEDTDSKGNAGTWGPLGFLMSDFDTLKPDKRNPDRMVKIKGIGSKKAPQLNWFVYLNKVDHVRTLLSAGASVNSFSESGESPILFAIEVLKPDGQPYYDDDTCFKLISEQPHKPETLNWRTTKKRLTPLTSAVQTGRPEVVGKLIEMGADPNFRGLSDNQAALNICMKMIGQIQNPEKYLAEIQRMHRYPTREGLEAMRRNMYGMAGIDLKDQELFLKSRLRDQRFQCISSALQELSVKQVNEHIRYEDMLSITKILIEAGADPNAKHTSPVNGYTPLMLAAELDEAYVFDLMLQQGGDPYVRYSHMGFPSKNCCDIAKDWRAERVMRVLDGLHSKKTMS